MDNIMSSIDSSGMSLLFYTGANYGGNYTSVAHGVMGTLANTSIGWAYNSVAMSDMHAAVLSQVNINDSSINYQQHIEDVITANISSLPALYPSAQLPLQYLGLDPAVVAVVWLEMDDNQASPNALASTSQVGGSTTNVTTLTLPGHRGMLSFVPLAEGSSVVANCRLGDYNTASGTVNWAGNGTVVLEYLGGMIKLISTSGFPTGWSFGAPQMNSDGSWKVVLNGGSTSADFISDLTSDKTSIADNGADIATLTATVKDSINGLVKSGVTVNWSSTLGNLNTLSSVTDSNGQANVQLSDNDAPGTATVTAAISGNSKSVNLIVSADPAGLSLYSDFNWQGSSMVLTEQQSTLLRDPLYSWNWKSVKTGSERLMAHSLLTLDTSTFDFRTYRDSYIITDVSDLTADFPAILSAPTVQGTTLGENDVVVRVLLLPDDKTQKVVACATQTWPQVMNTASVANGVSSVEGILVVLNKTKGLVTVPLQLGVMDDNGLVAWQYTTTLVASWDESRQIPLVVLGNDAPTDWILYPAQPTANAGEFKTALSGVLIQNKFTMYCVTDAVTTMVQSNAVNPIGFHGTPGAEITVSVDGPASVVTTNPVILDDLGYGRVDISSSQAVTVVVTAVGSGYTVVDSMKFVSAYTVSSFGNYQLTQNAPADGRTPNMVYGYDTARYPMYVDQHAVYDTGTNSKIPSTTTFALEVTDTFSEDVNVHVYNNAYPLGKMNFVEFTTPEMENDYIHKE